MKIRTFCFFAAFGATIFACSGKGSDVANEGTDTSAEDLVVLCGKGECGPELGMPAEICSDGSIAGNTGRCIKSTKEPKCHWEIKKCPIDPKCDCGPEPMMPVEKCWDGSTSSIVCGPFVPPPPPPCGGSGGGTGTAGSGSADPAKPPPAPTPGPTPTPGPDPSPVPGKCGWQIKPCPPPPPPPPCDCGPMPMYAVKCPDGSVAKEVCEPSPKASPSGPACEWVSEFPTPPPPPVDCSAPGACGPALGMPNYLCPDGKTVAGPGACIDQGGKCGWEIISCPPTK